MTTVTLERISRSTPKSIFSFFEASEAFNAPTPRSLTLSAIIKSSTPVIPTAPYAYFPRLTTLYTAELLSVTVFGVTYVRPESLKSPKLLKLRSGDTENKETSLFAPLFFEYIYPGNLNVPFICIGGTLALFLVIVTSQSYQSDVIMSEKFLSVIK